MTNSSQERIINEHEFEELFKSHYSAMCRSVNRIIKSSENAEDIVQEVFINFWENRNDYPINSSLKSYLYKAVINKSLNFLKKNQKWEILEEAEIEKIEKNFILQQNNSEELSLLIETSIAKLPIACRTMFVMSRYEELSYKEIAELTNTSIKTVENQIGKALKILRIDLKDHLIIIALCASKKIIEIFFHLA